MNPDSEIKDNDCQTFEELLHEIGELLKLAEIEAEFEKNFNDFGIIQASSELQK